jgi:hypothetical protein
MAGAYCAPGAKKGGMRKPTKRDSLLKMMKG